MATKLNSEFIETTGSGTITTGAYYVAVSNEGSAVGTINGCKVAAGKTLTLPPVAAMQYGSIPYDATGTTFYITIIRSQIV
jgi:hypothetical protein